jgi:hypothetical protein
MNGLYGYPMSGAALADLGRFSGMGASEAENRITVTGIISGQTYKDLKALQSEIMRQAGTIGGMGMAAEKAAPSQRAQLSALWQQARAKNLSARANWQKAADNYNEIVNKIRSYSFQSINPPSLSGLGAEPVTLSTAVVVGLVVVGAAVLIAQFSNFWAVARGDTNASRGYIDQFAELAKQGGVVIEKSGRAVVDVSEGLSKTAWAVVGLVGAWAIYRFVKGGGLRRFTGAGGGASSMPATLDLKPVEVKVLT